MSVYPIPIASTPHMVVTKRVSWRGADWAFFIFREQRETQPVVETYPIFTIQDVEAEGRRRNNIMNIEPVSSVLKGSRISKTFKPDVRGSFKEQLVEGNINGA